jgi:Protein of unknown function (DUF1501)
VSSDVRNINLTRRHLFQNGGIALGAVALSELLRQEGAAAADALRSGPVPHLPARAKNVIYLHMIGAPSQLDLFDDKPELRARDGQDCPESYSNGREFAFIGGRLRLAGSRFRFRQHGDSGQIMSELLPELATVADDISVIRSLHTKEINHAPAQMFLHSGFGRGGRPSLGSWVTYGLGSENHDLPAYVVLLSGPPGGAGTNLWSTGFLPSVYQGIRFRGRGDPVLFLSNPEDTTVESRRRVLDAVSSLNQIQLADVGDPEIATRISQYEMAWRMQSSVPDLLDLSDETPQTLRMYGAEPGKESFANNCLLARRLVERGVRIVQLFDSDWDHHANLATRLPTKCRDIDRPCAALIRDLRQRGLLDETIVVWGAEFGRTPLAQAANMDGKSTRRGRDHHKDAFTMWVAGGGIKGGVSCGQTDPLGFDIVERPVATHDLNATILRLLGIDHERLTFRYQGRDFRLTDVHGEVVSELLA